MGYNRILKEFKVEKANTQANPFFPFVNILLIYLSIVCAHVCMDAHAHVCMYRGQRLMSGWPPQLLSILFFETVSHQTQNSPIG